MDTSYLIGSVSKCWFVDTWLLHQILSPLRDCLPNGQYRIVTILEMTTAIEWYWQEANPTLLNSKITTNMVGARFKLFKEKHSLTLSKHKGYWLKCDVCATLRFLKKKVPKHSPKFIFFDDVCYRGHPRESLSFFALRSLKHICTHNNNNAPCLRSIHWLPKIAPIDGGWLLTKPPTSG